MLLWKYWFTRTTVVDVLTSVLITALSVIIVNHSTWLIKYYTHQFAFNLMAFLAGELLATYDDNARDFLFPTPRVSPTYPGVDREVLLQRSSTFAGIAPKLEFSSRTVIKEVWCMS